MINWIKKKLEGSKQPVMKEPAKMPIQYVKGDLFETDAPIIAHGCNAQGVMGSGVAKIIKKKYPRAWLIYSKQHRAFELEVGQTIHVMVSPEKWIFNCITQEFYGREKDKVYIDYDAIRKCMKEINTNWSRYEKIAMPKIGAGLGGGDWDKISQIIEEELTDIQPIVYEL